MAEAVEIVNPRHLREKYGAHVGKRVTVGTTTYHYLCGTWKEMAGDRAVFQIGEHEMRVPLAEIATVADAPAWQSDFFK
jgi:hypothetical protein